jgi:hypothetical protein
MPLRLAFGWYFLYVVILGALAFGTVFVIGIVRLVRRSRRK